MDLSYESRSQAGFTAQNNGLRPHGGYRVPNMPAHNKLHTVFEMYQENYRHWCPGKRQHPPSISNFNKSSEFHLDSKENELNDSFNSCSKTEKEATPRYVFVETSEISHSGESALFSSKLLAPSKLERDGHLNFARELLRPTKCNPPMKGSNGQRYYRPNSTHQYLTVTDLKDCTEDEVNIKFGRPTRTTLLRARQRCNSAPVKRTVKREFEEPARPRSARARGSKPEIANNVATNGESYRAFILGARYNTAHNVDANSLRKYKTYVSRSNPAFCFTLHPNLLQKGERETPPAPPDTPVDSPRLHPAPFPQKPSPASSTKNTKFRQMWVEDDTGQNIHIQQDNLSSKKWAKSCNTMGRGRYARPKTSQYTRNEVSLVKMNQLLCNPCLTKHPGAGGTVLNVHHDLLRKQSASYNRSAKPKTESLHTPTFLQISGSSFPAGINPDPSLNPVKSETSITQAKTKIPTRLSSKNVTHLTEQGDNARILEQNNDVKTYQATENVEQVVPSYAEQSKKPNNEENITNSKSDTTLVAEYVHQVVHSAEERNKGVDDEDNGANLNLHVLRVAEYVEQVILSAVAQNNRDEKTNLKADGALVAAEYVNQVVNSAVDEAIVEDSKKQNSNKNNNAEGCEANVVKNYGKEKTEKHVTFFVTEDKDGDNENETVIFSESKISVKNEKIKDDECVKTSDSSSMDNGNNQCDIKRHDQIPESNNNNDVLASQEAKHVLNPVNGVTTDLDIQCDQRFDTPVQRNETGTPIKIDVDLTAKYIVNIENE